MERGCDQWESGGSKVYKSIGNQTSLASFLHKISQLAMLVHTWQNRSVDKVWFSQGWGFAAFQHVWNQTVLSTFRFCYIQLWQLTVAQRHSPLFAPSFGVYLQNAHFPLILIQRKNCKKVCDGGNKNSCHLASYTVLQRKYFLLKYCVPSF